MALATRTQKHKPLVFTEGFGWHKQPPCEGTQITKTVGTVAVLGEQPNPSAWPHSTSTNQKAHGLAPEQTRKASSPSRLFITPVLRGLEYQYEHTKELVSHWESSDNHLQTITAVSYARTSKRLGRGNATASDRQENLPWHLCAAVKSSPNLNAGKKRKSSFNRFQVPFLEERSFVVKETAQGTAPA